VEVTGGKGEWKLRRGLRDAHREERRRTERRPIQGLEKKTKIVGFPITRDLTRMREFRRSLIVVPFLACKFGFGTHGDTAAADGHA